MRPRTWSSGWPSFSCANHRINSAYGPYPLAKLFWDGERGERVAGREFWIAHRPSASIQVPWGNAQHYWGRVKAALSHIPRLQDDPRFTPSAFFLRVDGSLTPAVSNFVRAYFAEMASYGSGHHIDLAYQIGVLGHHPAPFFSLLDIPGRPPIIPAA